MATLDEKEARVLEAIRDGFRGRLLARGQARSIIWRDGVLPTGAPQFGAELTYDLLSYGFSLLSDGLDILENDGRLELARSAFENAAWAIESVITNGEDSPERGFHRFVAAASYHLAGYTARAFSLLANEIDEGNLTVAEKSLGLLILRSLDDLEVLIHAQLEDTHEGDEELTQRLATIDGEENEDELGVVVSVLESGFIAAMATAHLGFERGERELVDNARERLTLGMSCCAELSLVNQWWCHRLATFLLGDLWSASFHERLPVTSPSGDYSQWGELRELFIGSLYRRSRSEIELWPSQIDAAKKVVQDEGNLVVSLPTSAGKTRIAEICMLVTLAQGRRVLYVTPLRALSAQTESSLARTFRPIGKSVSSLYGGIGASSVDERLLGNRDIVVSTPEKLDFALRNDPSLIDDVGLIVLDEGHMIGLEDREVRYEVQVQRLLRRSDAATRRIVCLSAVLPDNGDEEDFVEWLTEGEGEDGLVRMNWRPTRLRYGEVLWQDNRARVEYQVESEESFVPSYFEGFVPPVGKRKKSFPSNQRELCLATTWKLVNDGHSVLIYCPLRRSVEPFAKSILDLYARGALNSVLVANPDELRRALAIGGEWLGADSTLLTCLKLGVAVHHGALPTPYRREVEQLLRDGVLRVTVSSPTLAQGLNLTASAIVFHGIIRNRKLIKLKEFRNVVGRAGRAYVDVEGQALFPVFNSGLERQKRLEEWRNFVNGVGSLKLESGLALLVSHLLRRLISRHDKWSPASLKEYVCNGENWEFISKNEQEADEEKIWNVRISCLDTAVLGLLEGEGEIADDEIENLLDEVLKSSLWARCLNKRNEGVQTVLKIGLSGRARVIFRTTSASQRRAYFLAGVGLRTGCFLDEKKVQLWELLVNANAAIATHKSEKAISAISDFAEIVFKEPPFVPNPEPNNWREVLKVWLSGDPLSGLVNTEDPDVLRFVEDGLIFKLSWAMEAVRVHGETLKTDEREDEIDAPDLGYAVAAVETGTLSVSAAVLMQAGFASRKAAIKAIEDGEANFKDLRGLSRWVKSDLVAKLSQDTSWPTTETHDIWTTFVDGLGAARTGRWRKSSIEVPVHWFDSKFNRAGLPVRLSQVDGRTAVFSDSFEALGEADVILPDSLEGVLRATVVDEGTEISLSYIGPERPFDADAVEL